MNPRLVEPGFAVVCLHADVPARPGKDQDDENEAQGGGRHVEQAGYLHGRPRCKAGDHAADPIGRTPFRSGVEPGARRERGASSGTTRSSDCSLD